MSRKHGLTALAVVLVAGILATGSVVAAQDQTPPPPKAHGMMNRLQQRLGLTDDQVAKIKDVYQQNHEAYRQVGTQLRDAQQALRQAALNGDDATVQAKKAEITQLLGQMLDLRVNTLKQISPILTPEQRAKYAELRPWGGRHRRAS